MKKYVFLQPSICGMGGAQQYLQKKIKVLREEGWQIYIISAEHGDIMIDSLKEFSNTCIEGIRYSTCYYRKRDVDRMSEKAIGMIAPTSDDHIIIESATASMALWGEVIAQKIHCRHVCFDFEEIFTNLTQTQLKFMDFKHRRKELCGIAPRSLPLMFKGYKDVPESEAYSYRAMCSDPVDDADSELAEVLKKYDRVIGTVGRAEKPYLIPTLRKIKEYIDKHSNHSYAVLHIGGAKEQKYSEEAKALFAAMENVDFYTTGMIYPIPRCLVNEVDVFVSSSGSASATAREGRPTIAVSASTFDAIGILNYTTRYSALPDQEKGIDIVDQIELVLDERYCENHDPIGLYKGLSVAEQALIEFKKQIDFVLDNKTTLEYYDISTVKKEGKMRFLTIASKLVGGNLFNHAIRVLENSNIKIIRR